MLKIQKKIQKSTHPTLQCTLLVLEHRKGIRQYFKLYTVTILNFLPSQAEKCALYVLYIQSF
jgi:hypothetical protein